MTFVTPQDFGALGDSTYDEVTGTFTAGADDTSGMVAFFNHCISTGERGFIPKGGYHVDWGALAFDNGNTDTPWPIIESAGPAMVTLFGRGSADAPMVSITNGTASVFNDKVWNGGSLGGFTVRNILSQTGATNRHALQLSGIQSTSFGKIIGYDLQGSLLFIPTKGVYLDGTGAVSGAPTKGYTPDPHHVFDCDFAGLLAYRCLRWTVENRNFNGLVSNRFNVVRTANNGLGTTTTSADRKTNPQCGLFYGFGATNKVLSLTGGSIRGWAAHDGSDKTCHGGVPTSLHVDTFELDDVEYGILLGRAKFCRFKGRMIHRKGNLASLNGDDVWWPLVAVQFGIGVAPDSKGCDLMIEHRIDAPTEGTTKADLGAFTDFNNVGGVPNAAKLDFWLQDNVSFGVEASDLYDNLHPEAGVKMSLGGKVFYDHYPKSLALASYSGTLSVPSSGYSGAGSILAFNNEREDHGQDYDPSGGTPPDPQPDYSWKAPSTGLALAIFSLPLSVPSGTVVRMGILENDGGVYAVKCHRRYVQNINNAVQHHQVAQIIEVTAHRTYHAIADQNSGGSVNASPQFAAASESVFQVMMV